MTQQNISETGTNGTGIVVAKRVVVYDHETVEIQSDGSLKASTEAYRPNFRVTSCAFTWRDGTQLKSKYLEGEDNVRVELQALAAEGARMVAHNFGFETMVDKCRFPGVSLNYYADTMRLAQVYDSGGDESDFVLFEEEDILVPGDKPKITRKPTQGFGLVKCVQRILGDTSDHKKEAHDYIMKETGCKPKQCGSNLHVLPSDLMEKYNVLDTENTYRLYEFLVDHFRYIQYDWTLDHQLFFASLHRVVDSQIKGVPVDRVKLEQSRQIVDAEVQQMGTDFRVRFAKEIGEVEADRLQEYLQGVKTDKGRQKRLDKFNAKDPKAVKGVEFNPGSNSQLGALFMEKLKIVPQFFTDKGAPSFKSSMLHQWNEGGEMLKARRKRLLVLKQMESLLELSAFDGRWHLSLKIVSTATGRMAGGSY